MNIKNINFELNLANDAKSIVETLISQKKITVDKYNDQIEYEVKLDYFGESSDIEKINSVIKSYVSDLNICVDNVEKYSDYDIEYFSDGNQELSLFIYEEKPILKMKKHNVMEYKGNPIFCNEEAFNYDLDSIKSKLEESTVNYVSTMNKKRLKDFFICKDKFIIYASATTICSINSKIQIQYELEYYRHIPVEGIEINEEIIMNQLSHICTHIAKKSAGEFKMGTEIKCDFARKHHYETKTNEDAMKSILNVCRKEN